MSSKRKQAKIKELKGKNLLLLKRENIIFNFKTNVYQNI